MATADPRLDLALTLGPEGVPGTPFPPDVLRRAWQVLGPELMARCAGTATRPWGWWRFVARAPRPDDVAEEGLRLRELGELRDEELPALGRALGRP